MTPKTDKHVHRIVVYVHKDFNDWLRWLASSKKVSMSDAIRSIVDAYRQKRFLIKPDSEAYILLPIKKDMERKLNCLSNGDQDRRNRLLLNCIDDLLDSPKSVKKISECESAVGGSSR